MKTQGFVREATGKENGLFSKTVFQVLEVGLRQKVLAERKGKNRYPFFTSHQFPHFPSLHLITNPLTYTKSKMPCSERKQAALLPRAETLHNATGDCLGF